VAHDADALAAETAEPADDGLVLAEDAVAGQRREVLEQLGDVVERVRPARMAGDQRLLPGGEALVEVPEGLVGLLLEARHLLGDGHASVARGDLAQFLDLGFEFGDRLFEIEVAAHRQGCGPEP